MVGCQMPVSRRARVDLPAALGPMMASASPASEVQRHARQRQLLRARQAERDALDPHTADRPRQRHARLVLAEMGAQVAQAAIGRARLVQDAPAADDLLHRLQGAAEQDGGGDHHARRSGLRENQVGADRHHHDLHALAQEARRGAEASRSHGWCCLAAQAPRPAACASGPAGARSCPWPAAPRRCAAILPRSATRWRVSFCTASSALRFMRSLSQARPIITIGGPGRPQAQRRVEEGDDGHVDDDPRRVHQRRQSVGREQAAQRRDVAHRIRPRTQRRPGRSGDDRVHHRRREPLVDEVADEVLQAQPHVVEHEQDAPAPRRRPPAGPTASPGCWWESRDRTPAA